MTLLLKEVGLMGLFGSGRSCRSCILDDRVICSYVFVFVLESYKK